MASRSPATASQVLNAIAGDKDKGNQGDGIRVGGVGNLLQDNRANANGGSGLTRCGTSVGPNRLKNNQSNPAASGTENGGGEYVLLNYVKNDGGGNRADGIVVPKTPAPVKCPAFPAANATVNFPSASALRVGATEAANRGSRTGGTSRGPPRWRPRLECLWATL